MVLESAGLALHGTGAELISNPHVRHAYLGGRRAVSLYQTADTQSRHVLAAANISSSIQ
jgi:hypothetical protein